ncbi:MAG: penicillin acylase family protein [Deltaproteobacteria bacterium]|nr:penicillin acylase family protein [Deltaproteobacteria bacterium]
MSKFIKRAGLELLIVILIIIGFCTNYLYSKKAVRSGNITLPGLTGLVNVRFDTFAIPHIYAENETDAYYALGYVHAQERLFHMELLRRLAKGELSEILGPKLKSTDSFFRTLRLKQFGNEYMQKANKTTPAFKVSQAYLDGINHYIHTRPAPIEFDILKIPKKDYMLSDIVSVSGYMAYSFAAGFKSDPVLTFIRDELGQAYLSDMDYLPSAVPPLKLLTDTHKSLAQMAGLVADIETIHSPVGFFEGSNAWAVQGNKTVSGKPILSGDPHIAHSCPSVWYEAHIITPNLNFYGHFLSGVPTALLGFNQKVAWTLTMFQNDDLDMFVEKANPDNPDQVWSNGKWTDLKIEHEIIKVKNEKDLVLKVRMSKHGPIINDILDTLNKEKRPVAVFWAFHDFSNDMLNGLYELSHIDSVFQASDALKKIHAPGLNFVMGDTKGNIGWWAVAKLPKRPDHVDPNFIQDGSDPSNDYLGTWPFESNPQFINPESGIIISANHQPQDFGNGIVPGYYNIENRAQRIETLLGQKQKNWSLKDMKAVQLDTESAFYKRIKEKEVDVLKRVPAIQNNEISKKAFEIFEKWDGFHHLNTKGAAIFYTLHYYLAKSLFKDELGDDLFKAFLRTRFPDKAVLKIMDLENSPWWDEKITSKKESQKDILSSAWFQTIDTIKRPI